MRILVLISLVSLLMVTASCKKEYVCQCNEPWTASQQDVTIEARNTKDAKIRCHNIGKGWDDGFQDCILK